MRSRLHSSRFAFALVLACAALAATGCQILPKAQPDPTRYYILSTPSPFTTREFTPPEVQVRLGLQRVGLPAYLATTPNLVVRRGDNEITYLRDSRWAEDLSVGIRRLLTHRLSSSAKVDGVEMAPFLGQIERDFDLTVDVQRAEGVIDAAGNATTVVELTYTVTTPGAGGAVTHRGTLQAPAQSWDPAEPASLVAALSTAILQAGHALVAELPLKTPADT
jgi:uncharacterized lipoprotein YmbA